MMKRFFDILVAGLLLMSLSPVFSLCWLLNCRRVVGRKEFLGRNGVVFSLKDYRAESRCGYGMLALMTGLISILKGEMSIVGPRLRTVEEAEEMKAMSEDFVTLLDVAPGMLSESLFYIPNDAEHRMQVLAIDLRYVCNRTFFHDLAIVFDAIVFFVTNRI